MLLKRNKVIIVLFGTIILGVLGELISRFIFGLGTAPLYIESEKFEYIYAPNQNILRFGNHIITNEYSMRSNSLEEDDVLRILLIGDSIINGGAVTDQDSLASTILEKLLRTKFRKKIRILNVSAGSWGPDNALAYIKQYSHFNAQIIVFVFSSHDYYDTMTFKKIVGINESYPNKQPLCALSDGLTRYLIPRVNSWISQNNIQSDFAGKNTSFNGISNQEAYSELFAYAAKNKMSTLFYLHPELYELLNKKYVSNGIETIKLLEKYNIPYIIGIEKNSKPEYYRDDIHLNEQGQKFLANTLFPYISTTVSLHLKTSN